MYSDPAGPRPQLCIVSTMYIVQHAPLHTVSFSKVKALSILTFFAEVYTRSNLRFTETVIGEH
jgi:hypothetical protein